MGSILLLIKDLLYSPSAFKSLETEGMIYFMKQNMKFPCSSTPILVLFKSTTANEKKCFFFCASVKETRGKRCLERSARLGELLTLTEASVGLESHSPKSHGTHSLGKPYFGGLVYNN